MLLQTVNVWRHFVQTFGFNAEKILSFIVILFLAHGSEYHIIYNETGCKSEVSNVL